MINLDADPDNADWLKKKRPTTPSLFDPTTTSLAGHYDPTEPRVPAGAPDGGQWTEGGGAAADVTIEQISRESKAQFQALKDRWAKLNTQALPLINHPDDPDLEHLLIEMKEVSKAMYRLRDESRSLGEIGQLGGVRDITIVGAGPGGLSAAVMGGTDGLDTLFIDANPEPGGQARFSSRIENYPGFPVGVSGADLARTMHDQAIRVGAEGKLGVRVEAMSIDPVSEIKTLILSNGERIESRSVIIAGGVAFKRLEFPGSESDRVTYGDGQTLARQSKGGSAVVVGGGNGAAQAALAAAIHASEVTIISRSPIVKSMSDYQVQQLRNHPKIRIIEGDEVASLKEGRLVTKRGQSVPASAVGLFLGGPPATGWLPKQVTLEPDGKVRTNRDYETTMPGVFAIGDVRAGGIGRVGAAVGEGQIAQRNVFTYFDKLRAKQQAHPITPRPVGLRTAAGRLSPAMWDRLVDRLFAVDHDQPFLSQSVEPDADLRDLAYNPAEPRVPAGSPNGGQWTGDETAVGITSSRPGKPNREVFAQMRAFEGQLKALPTITGARVEPGMGAWENGEEPAWVVRYTGNGAATKLLAATAKHYDQDAVLVMKPCRAKCDPVVDLTFDRPVSRATMAKLAPVLTAAGVGGWTWAKEGGHTVLRAASVPAWGGERTQHLANMQRVAADLTRAGLTHTVRVRGVTTEVLDRSTYDTVLGGS